MAITVMIPAPLRKYTGGADEVTADGATLADVIQHLGSAHDGLTDRIVDETGEVRRFINVFVNEEDVRFLDGSATALRDGDVVSLIPAVAGG